jgi:hypothetical protein
MDSVVKEEDNLGLLSYASFRDNTNAANIEANKTSESAGEGRQERRGAQMGRRVEK